MDLSTSAGSYNEAVANFYEMFQLHIEICVDAGTLQEDLLSHRWKFRKGNIGPRFFFLGLDKQAFLDLLESS